MTDPPAIPPHDATASPKPIRALRRSWLVFSVAFCAGVGVDIMARAVAQTQFGDWTFADVVGHTFGWRWALLPVFIVGMTSAASERILGARSLGIIFPFVIAPHATWTYLGHFGSLSALAEHKWTASALAGGFAWLYSTFFVFLVSCFTLAFAVWLKRNFIDY